MSTIELEQVKQRSRQVRELIRTQEALLAEQPGNFAQRLALSSLHSHLEDLHRQTLLLQAEIKHELIDFRLIGNQVTDGTIRLGLLGKIAGPLSDVLGAIAYKFRYAEGENSGGYEHVKRLLDVRLAGIGEGSTRLYLTANAASDLSGNCLLHDSMAQLFALLNSNHEDFFDSVHAMGAKATRAAEMLLKAMETEEVAAEISWVSPTMEAFHWDGRTDRISQLRAWLEQAEESQTEIMELRGAVSLVSDAARLEIREDDKTRRTKIKYLKDKLPMIENLKVGQRVILEVERTSFFDKTEQKLVERYSLVNVLSQAVEN